jgi:ABC-type uncharacterized transport system permease subunit
MARPQNGARKYTVAMSLSIAVPTSFFMSSFWGLWVSSALAFIAYAAAGMWRANALVGPRIALALAWLAHGVAIGLDIAGVGSPLSGARFGFATALSATAWLVLLIYAIESRWLHLAALSPGEFRTHASSPWAPLHWALGLASYGLFGAAVLHAALLDRAERRLRLKRAVAAPTPGQVSLLGLERLTFQLVAAGLVLLSATLVLGWWFANPWRWDHKTVLSLLGWVVFAGLWLGRIAFGWRGRRAIRWLYAGALLLLLAYVGSRFVLGVVLTRPLP